LWCFELCPETDVEVRSGRSGESSSLEARDCI